MANLPEVAQWTSEEDGIYQFELDDFITGGPGGNDNEPHRLLANRTRFLKERQESIMGDILELQNRADHVGGFKNIWIDGAFRIWDDGVSGEYTQANDPRYGYGVMIMRNTYDAANAVWQVGGTYTWERVEEYHKQWLRMSHADAVGSGYIGQRWDRSILQYLKGKTVTLSFLYKATVNMTGRITFYNEQNAVHDGIGVVMGTDVIDYVGDGNIHKAEVTISLTDDNIDPDGNAYFGIQIGYGSGADGSGAIPNGSIQFTEIQFEISEKATEFEYVDLSIERYRYSYYYRRPSSIYSHPYASYLFCTYDFGTPMRADPAVNFSQSNDNSFYRDYSNRYGVKLYFQNDGAADYQSVSNVICDARIY